MDLFTGRVDGVGVEPTVDVDPAADFVDTFYGYYDPRYEIVNVGTLNEEDSFIIDLYTHSPSWSGPLTPTPRSLAFASHMYHDPNSYSPENENENPSYGPAASFIDKLVEALAVAEVPDALDSGRSTESDSDAANSAVREDLKAKVNINTGGPTSESESERGRRGYKVQAEKTHESSVAKDKNLHDTPRRDDHLTKEIVYAHT